MGMTFVVDIGFDPVALLTKKPDVVKKTKETLVAEADYYEEQFVEELSDRYGQEFREAYFDSYLSFVDYVSVKKDTITFDFGETMENARYLFQTIVYNVDIDFDDERYMDDLRKEKEAFLTEKLEKE